jgi:hypothetical protein
MSDKDLQRVTVCVSDIGQPASRRSFPSRRDHITQKVRIADQRIFYISVHDDSSPSKLFLLVKKADCTLELIGLYDVVARLISVALQYGTSLEKLGDLLTGAGSDLVENGCAPTGTDSCVCHYGMRGPG